MVAFGVNPISISCFNPEALGEIEFHSSRRFYAREAVNTVRLNVGDRSEERRNRFLYDLENKYKNVKSQLSEEYVATLLKGADPKSAPLQRSIKELFRTFFPGKEFLGVTLGEKDVLTFPVRLSTGETHDIDELSSGEKEIVYGYLWLRTGVRIESQNAVEAAVLDLIGDLAAYRPYAKIVLVEGHKETRFDVDMIRRLFPELAERANFIPVGNRRMTMGVRVRLLEVLKEAGLTGRAVSISDSDLGLGSPIETPGHYQWSTYEIENFLLNPAVLRSAAAVMLRSDPYHTDDEVVADLRSIAETLVAELALDEVQYALNGECMSAVKIGGDPREPVEGLERSAASSQERFHELDLSRDRIARLFEESCKRMRAHVGSEAFLQRFPGDRLLRAFAGKLGISGDHYRNACLDAAQRLGTRPPDMERTLLDALA